MIRGTARVSRAVERFGGREADTRLTCTSRRTEPELRLRLPVRARDCRGELMLCTPGMSYEDGMILSTTLARPKSATLTTGRSSCARSTFYGIESVSEESREKTQPRRRTSGVRSRCAMPELEGRDHRLSRAGWGVPKEAEHEP
jgi:hypothetical protein